MYSNNEYLYENESYVCPETLESDNQIRTVGWSIGMFLFGFIPVFILCASEGGIIGAIFGLVFGLIPGLFLGLIGSAIAHYFNVENARKVGADDVERREKIKCVGSIVSAATGAAFVAKKATRTAKDITNVDGWKQMK